MYSENTQVLSSIFIPDLGILLRSKCQTGAQDLSCTYENKIVQSRTTLLITIFITDLSHLERNFRIFFYKKETLKLDKSTRNLLRRSNNCIFFLHFSATGLLCGAIMSDHWEEIGWDKENLIHVNLTWYLDGQVAMLKSSVNHRTNRITKSSSFLVPMHGGIWIMCVTLSGTSCYNSKIICCNQFFLFTNNFLSPSPPLIIFKE